MSTIEENGKGVIADMIRGKSVELDLRQQETIATWLSLKAIVARHLESAASPVSQEARDYFFQHHRPPNTWHVWIAYYDGLLPVYMGATDISAALNHKLLRGPWRSEGILATFVIGYLAGQVFGVSETVPMRHNPSLHVEIWPHPLLAASVGYSSSNYVSKSWPPTRAIDDKLLEQMNHSLPQDF